LLAVVAVALVVACARIAAVPGPTPSPGFVPWVALPPSHQVAQEPAPVPSPPLTLPAGAQACTAGQLEGVGDNGGAGGGHHDLPVFLRNKSAQTCWLEGYPDIVILDASGKALAQAVGESSRGTYFSDGRVVRLPMDVGTPALNTNIMATINQNVASGQAFFNVEWHDCAQRQAATMRVTLPNGGGQLQVPYNFQGPQSAACPVAGAPRFSLSRGPFSPGAVTWTIPYVPFRVTIAAPASVARGTTLVYRVTVANLSTDDHLLDPCPDYTEILGAKEPVAEYQLNCAAVGRIPAGKSVTFEMKMDVPATVPAGRTRLLWALDDPRLDGAMATTPIEVR
jgi:hypothetical protein